MDNLPKDPPDENNSNPTPPPFGTNFNPHANPVPSGTGANPVDPNNPYSSQSSPTPQNSVPEILNNPDSSKHSTYSEVAQHKIRDAHGRFIHSEHLANSPPNPPNTPNIPTPNPSAPSNPPPTGLPPIIEINQNTKPTDKKDPPLFGFFLTNPVTYLKAFLSKLLKRQMITLRIPVLALIIIMAGVGGGLGGFGIGFKSGINYGLGKLFPNFSPIFHRSITAQGTIQKSSKGYYLQANDKDKTMWTLNPTSNNVNLADYVGMKVQIKGNLTPTPNLIDVSEVISFDTKPSPSPTPNTSKILSEVEGPNLSNPSDLPKLFPNLTWEVTQSKTLLFTSGKRRIEQEGVYLESSQVTDFPQDFIDYYINQLTNANFKQTFNSSEPSGTTITYAKDDLFLTFGVKNVFQGSGDNKKVVGYKAFIEHN